MSIYWSIFMTACCFEAEELVLIEGRTQDPSSTVRGERRGRYEYLWVLRWKEPQWKASVSLGKGNKRGHQGFCHVKKLNSSGLIRSYRARQMNTSYCSQCPVLVCRAELTVSLFWPPPPFSRVRRVLQPLPEWGPGHAVCQAVCLWACWPDKGSKNQSSFHGQIASPGGLDSAIPGETSPFSPAPQPSCPFQIISQPCQLFKVKHSMSECKVLHNSSKSLY